jgi:hypothetical protein
MFGRIGEHNVVIACLGSGDVGSASAAIVAAHTLSSFPSNRFGLLVGIGGGLLVRATIFDWAMLLSVTQKESSEGYCNMILERWAVCAYRFT